MAPETLLSVVLSLALHTSAAAALLLTWSSNDSGAIRTPGDAISIEVAPSNVVDQANVEPTSVDSGAQASVAETAGREIDSIAAAASPKEVPEAREVEPAPTIATLDPTLVKPEIEEVVAGTAEAGHQSAPPEQKTEQAKDELKKPIEHQEKKVERKEREVTKKRNAENSTKGGVTSKASSSAKSGTARVSASTGDIAGYAARVRARVASNKPSLGGHQGTAVVSFGVSSSGGVTYVRLSRSSGNGSLDQAALAAVRRAAPFPAPPSGASGRQLAFAVPFHFR